MGIDANIVKAGDLAAWTDAAVTLFVESATQALEERGRFSVALAGGNTPRQVYEKMADDPRVQALDWTKISILFGDERCVPPSDPASNAGMAATAFTDHIGIPAENVKRMRGELEPEEAAKDYEAVLVDLFGGTPGNGAPPKEPIDLVLLGLGTNGHTASLFPGLIWYTQPERWVLAEYVEVATTWRLTLTPLVINAARKVVFLVEGDSKTEIVARVLEGPLDPIVLPSQTIASTPDPLWLLDDAAASALTR